MNVGIIPSYRGPAVATPGYASAFAAAAEEAGCESVWVVEHVVVPTDYGSRYPYAPGGRMPLATDQPIPDPLDWLAFVAGTTERVRLGTAVLVLPEHNPVILAKRLATIDALSGGRMVLGIGVGWLREEADAVGATFDDRGARTDEYVEAMRALWRDDVASFRGRFVAFDDVCLRPRPVQPGGVPIVIGGHSPAAARRAGRLGDGFFPLGGGPDEVEHLLGVVRAEAEAAGRDPRGIELTVNGPRDVDTARRFVELGASRFVISARAEGDVDGARRAIGEFMDGIVARL